jgi:hypothetical protein
VKEGSLFALAVASVLTLQPGLMPAALAQVDNSTQGLPAYSPAPGTTPGLTPGMASGATPGTLSVPAAGTGGFAGLNSRSNPSMMTSRNRGAALPTSAADPRMANMMGLVPKFDPSFLQQLQTNNLPSGTVLTGILENTVSSKKSQAGDIFSIRLEDGFTINGVEVIPKQSKILGSVSSVLSSHVRHGAHPGTITISLQTLIFPDGRTTPFWGFIEHNPLDDNTNQSGSHIKSKAAGYGRMASYGTVNFITKKVGYNLQPPNFGKELELKQGEVLPVKTNRIMDLSKMTAPISQLAMPPGAVNGMYQSGTFPPGMQAASPNSLPGLPPYVPTSPNYAAAAGGVPGLPGGYGSSPMSLGNRAPAYVPPAGSGQPSIPYPSQMEPF